MEENSSTENLEQSGNDEDVEAPIFCDPRKNYYRFGALFFMCFLGFGSYFCYDTPGALQDEIKSDMHVSTMQFASLYSLYSWPNVILSFIGGFLIDKLFGIRLGALIFSSIVTVGQIAYAFGALINQFWLMQLGRFVFGIGGESLAVAQNAYTVAWFKGKELNTVFGLLLSMSRIGSTVNFLSMAPLYKAIDKMKSGHVTLGISLLIAGSTCVVSLFCALVLGLMDRRRVAILHADSANRVPEEKIRLRDILTFPLSFWLLSIICVTYYVTIFPFIGLAQVFFMRKYNMTESAANGVSSIVYVISVIGSPAFGFLVDRTGRNVLWVLVATLFTLLAHALLTFTFVNPLVPMVIMGLSYSLLASSLWPMVSLVLPEHQLGTAYGIMQSVQNLGLALISMLAGLIVDKMGYLWLEIFYDVWLCVTLLCCVVMLLWDSATGGILNLSNRQREQKIEEKAQEEQALLADDN